MIPLRLTNSKYKKIILSPYIDIENNKVRISTRIIDSQANLQRDLLLKKIDKDRKCKELLTRHVKRRMTKYGIIKKKRGKHIILTELGKELLKPHLSTPPLTRD